jgi:MOSC domain-containing protein YiiM
MALPVVGKVLGIAVRSREQGPMREVERVRATAQGLDGDVDTTTQRAVTFIASRQWEQVQRELSADLPWHTRRANVLIDCDSLAALIGKTVQVGAVRVGIHAETRPCGMMDELHLGLRKALTPDCRAGVYGSVLHDGEIAIGDVLSILE